MKIASFEVGLDQKLMLISGPCVIESEKNIRLIAETMADITTRLGINYVLNEQTGEVDLKALSYDEALLAATKMRQMKEEKEQNNE